MTAPPSGGLLFCDPGFHDLNGVPRARRWRYEHRRGSRLIGVLDAVATEGVLVSGHSAPYGGPDFPRGDPTLEDVTGLVDGALAAARAAGATTLTIACRPPVYSDAEPVLEHVLLERGFSVAHCALNQHVDLLPLRAGADPLLLLRTKRTPVRRGLAGDHELVEAVTAEDRATCHAILAANRAALRRPPGLPLQYLTAAQRAWPDLVGLLLLRQEGRPVAAAVVYRVLPDVDLLVNWGDARRGDHPYAMDLLAHLLVVRSTRTGARLLDLGPSSEKDGTPNTGLFNFKRSAGARATTRKVMTVRIHP